MRCCRIGLGTSKREEDAIRKALAMNGRNGSRNILEWLQCEHGVQQELCDVLESIADALPGPVDEVQAAFALTVLRTGLARHIALQERLLFPLLRRRARKDDLITSVIGQIELQNVTDEDLAHDAADQLERAVQRGRPDNPDMLGYLLRTVFECRRRHIVWEDIVLLPLARQRLHPDDLEEITSVALRPILRQCAPGS